MIIEISPNLLRVYAPNLLEWISNAWKLIDPLERLADSFKRIEIT